MKTDSRNWLILLAAFVAVGVLAVPADASPPAPQEESAEREEAQQDESTDDPEVEEEAEDPPSLRDEFEAILDTYQKRRADFMEKYQATTDAAERRKLSRELPRPAEYLDDVWELVEKSMIDDEGNEAINDRDLTETILTWVIQNGSGSSYYAKARDLFMEEFPDSKKMTVIAQMMGRAKPSPEVEETFAKIIQTSPHPSVKAGTMLAYATYLSSLNRYVDMIGEDADPSQKSAISSYLGETGVSYLEGKDDLSKEIKQLLNDLIENYPEEDRLVDRAKTQLFEIENLAIGCIAPEIEGEDLDGVAFKLSDYRGKVVVLDFWGHW